MSCSVTGYNSVCVLHVRQVVFNLSAKQIRKAAAGLTQNNLRRARVPLFGAGREVHIQIAALFDNQSDLDPNRSALDFLSHSKRFDNTIHSRATVRTTRS